MSDDTNQGRVRSRVAAGARRVTDPHGLAERVAELEAEVAELKQLHLRLAELTDVVQELLLPLSQRDEEGVTEVLERYRGELGT